MLKAEKFLKSQKILRIATIDSSGTPHIVPVWYRYIDGKFYVGTNTATKKARNIKNNSKVSFCIDIGINSPNIFGVTGTGEARLILKKEKVQSLAKKILLRYFENLKNVSAQQLLKETNCVIEIESKKIISWKY